MGFWCLCQFLRELLQRNVVLTDFYVFAIILLGKTMQEKLTRREKEILDLLIGSKVPKEIAGILNIAYDTVLFHQKKIYNKLGIHNINELLATMQNGSSVGTKIEFQGWAFMKDEYGSPIDVIKNDNEIINGKPFTTYTIIGSLIPEYLHSYADVLFLPTPSSVMAIRKMKCFSFMALGDGGRYAIRLTTPETDIISGDNYGITFSAADGEAIKIIVRMEELVQNGHSGIKVEFNLNNVRDIKFKPIDKGNFNLKVWDFRLY